MRRRPGQLNNGTLIWDQRRDRWCDAQGRLWTVNETELRLEDFRWYLAHKQCWQSPRQIHAEFRAVNYGQMELDTIDRWLKLFGRWGVVERRGHKFSSTISRRLLYDWRWVSGAPLSGGIPVSAFLLHGKLRST